MTTSYKKNLLRQLGEAKGVYWLTRIYGWLILYLAALLGFTILFHLIGVKTVYALIPSTLYIEFLVILQLLFKPNIVERIEQVEADFDGSLRTAYENREKKNVIVDDLLHSAESKLKMVGYSRLMDVEELTYRTLSTVILAFIFITLIVVSYQDLVLDLKIRETALTRAGKAIRENGERLFGGGIWESSEDYSAPEEEDELGASTGGLQPGFSEGPIEGKGGGVGGEANLDIYGEPGSANLWGQELDMELHPEFGGDVDVNEEAKTLGQIAYALPDVEGSEEYKDYPVEQEELVRKYFEKLLEGS
ncbi:MAG: hypothetical protein ABH851_03975 [Methanobacteriota archaeon]